jgi:ubiquinone/menaquinone biosynthesis C-methylase UbiE
MSEFDQYAKSYRDIINERAVITGESFEFFIDLRLRLLQERLAGAQPSRVLDFGCGMGDTQQAMRRLWPQTALDGVDPSIESIKRAQSLCIDRATFHVAAQTRLPFPDASFDLVYSNGTFHHIEHHLHAATLREIFRVLRQGGHVFICENNPFNPLVVYGMHRTPFDADAKMLFPRYLARLERAAGLRVNETCFYMFYPRFLKFMRWTERYLARVPVGGQYFVWGTKPPGRP